jgi:perosamine synthetase
MAQDGEKLALDGGPPVRASLLPYGHQQIEPADIDAVVEVLRSDWITTGPKVAEFEGAFAAYVNARYAVSFSSGTAALHAAAFACGLGPGDEAITTPLTFCATANAVLYQGARPVFVDVSADTLNLDPDQVASRITPRTKALLPVDYSGHPADLDAMLELASKHGLTVMEDASHALGAEYKGRRVGGISHMTIFSFHPVKHITTGEGGMVTTNDKALAEKLRMFRNHGISSDARKRQQSGQWYYEMAALGYNYRLPDFASALGLSQLRRIAANLNRRRQIAVRYAEAFRSEPAIVLPGVRSDVTPAWHLYPIRINPQVLATDRDQIFRALRAENIGVNVHYIPVHLHPYYREQLGHRPGECPVAEAAFEQLISIPMFHAMSDQDVEDVIGAVHKVVQHYARGQQ